MDFLPEVVEPLGDAVLVHGTTRGQVAPAVGRNPHESLSPLPGTGATVTARFGPWGVSARIVRPARHRLPCSNGCRSPWAHCILGVRVEDVVPAVADLWSETYAA